MKKFFEKLGWQGTGRIVGVIVLALIVWQLWDAVGISWLAVSIALNVILVIILALVALRIKSWKRKYENTRARLEMTKETLAQNIEAQRFGPQDQNYIWKLDIDNALLTKLYGQAYSLAITEFHDVKLNGISIMVNPYQATDRTSILFRFYSRLADKERTYILCETGDMAEPPPSEPAKQEESRVTFDELPWVKYPDWSQFIRKSLEKVVPLSPTGETFYHIYTFAHLEPQWSICFKDGVTGEESIFSWDGRGDPISQELHKGG